jgi:trimethylamine--corrinoid protein Co-methyltransferase
MFNSSFLTKEEVEGIHQATLRILSEIGVVLTYTPALEVLTGSGATLKGNRVLFPAELVEKCLAKCPPRISVRGRGGQVKILGDGSLNFHNLGGAPNIFDYGTGQRRYANLQDVRDCTRLLDALENCNTITPFFTPLDVPGGLMSLGMYRHAIPYTTKPLQGPGVQFASEAFYAVKMAEVIGPAKEILTLSVSPVSPLSIPDHEAQAIMEIARLGITFASLPCPSHRPTECRAAGQHRPGAVGASRAAGHLLRPPGHDGTPHRHLGVGWTGAGIGLGRDGPDRSSLRTAGQCVRFFDQCPHPGYPGWF